MLTLFLDIDNNNKFFIEYLHNTRTMHRNRQIQKNQTLDIIVHPIPIQFLIPHLKPQCQCVDQYPIS